MSEASKPHSELVQTIREALELVYRDDMASADAALGALDRLVEQLEAVRRCNGELNRALRDAMAFIQPEVAGDYARWEALLAISFPSNPAMRPSE